MEFKQFLEDTFTLAKFSELHPLFVHFPIGLLLLFGFFTFLPQSKKALLEPAMDILLKVGVFFSILSCLTGYLLADLEEMNSLLVQQHQWLGISTTLVYVVLIFIPKYRTYITGLATILLLITISLGTIITHGSFNVWKEKVIHSVETILKKPIQAPADSPVKEEPIETYSDEKEEAVLTDAIEEKPALEISQEWIKSLSAKGLVVTKSGEKANGIALNFVNVSTLDPAILDQMMLFKDQILALRLNNIPLDKLALEQISQCRNLQNLQLANTQLSDESLLLLAQLPRLEHLNVYNNPLTDKGILALQKCTSLQKLFVWKTKVSQSALQELQKKLPALRIEGGFQQLSKPDSTKK